MTDWFQASNIKYLYIQINSFKHIVNLTSNSIEVRRHDVPSGVRFRPFTEVVESHMLSNHLNHSVTYVLHPYEN